MRVTLHIRKDDGSYEPMPTPSELRGLEPVLMDYQKAMLDEYVSYVLPVRGRGKSIVQGVLAQASASWPHGLRCHR